MRDQKSIIIPGPEMDGLWDRGVSGDVVTYSLQNTCPSRGFTEAKQIRFFPWGFKTRQGYTIRGGTDAAWTFIRQITAYATEIAGVGIVRGEIILSNADFYDSASPTPGTPIYGISDSVNSNFSIITIYGKIYLTEHNLIRGSDPAGVSAYVQVYVPGSGVASRPIAGTSTALGAATFVSSATAGNVVVGDHIFGVAFESDSGHISGITSAQVGKFTIAGASKSVDGATIPLGPTGTAKRHILASRVITGTYTGDPTDYLLFFTAEIPNNTATTITFNFTDESLVDSADYLYNLYLTINSGLGFCWYANRLVIFGIPNTNTANEVKVGTSVLLVSLPGQPESFDNTSGFIEVFVGDGDIGVLNVFEQDGLLVICKDNKTYVTRDNGGEPNTWEVAGVDYTLGSTVFGVTKSLDTTGASKSGKTITASHAGIYIFQGQYVERPLTWKIARRWQKIGQALNFNYYATQIIDIPLAKLFLVAVGPYTGTLPAETTFWFVCDYSLGLTWDKVRWAEWHPENDVNFMTLRDNNTLLHVSTTSDIFTSTIGSEDDDYVNTNDPSDRIQGCEVITSELRFDDLLNSYQINQIRVRGRIFTETGEEDFPVTLEIGDDSFSTAPVSSPSFNPPINNPSPEIIKALINFSGYYPRVRITWTGQCVEVRHIVVFGNREAEDFPTSVT